jgi:hypothetical protein
MTLFAHPGGSVAGVGLFSEEQVSRARRYRRPLYAAAIVRLILDLGVLALIVFSAFGNRLFAPFAGWPWWAGVVALTALVVGVRGWVGLPISFGPVSAVSEAGVFRPRILPVG